MSRAMRRIPEMFPDTVRWFSGADVPFAEMRALDQRTPPTSLRAAHDLQQEHVAGVDCWWVDPDHRDAGLIVFLHGGAYVMGPGAGQWSWIAGLCAATGMAALCPLYRRAPEHPFPAALDDALAVAAAIDGSWVLAGDSAGGGLAVALAMRLRDHDLPAPGAIALSSPWLDLTLTDPDEVAQQAIDPMLTIAGLERPAAAYAGTADRTQPGISPRFGDPTGLPPMHATVGTAELLLPEVRAFAARCAAAGTPFTLHEEPGGIHDYAIGLGFLPEADAALPHTAALLGAHAG